MTRTVSNGAATYDVGTTVMPCGGDDVPVAVGDGVVGGAGIPVIPVMAVIPGFAGVVVRVGVGDGLVLAVDRAALEVGLSVLGAGAEELVVLVAAGAETPGL